MKHFLATLFIGLMLAAPAQAQSRIDRREHLQRQRIGQGIRNGELTRREASRLAREQAKVRRIERRAKADGEITPSERRKLNRRLDAANRHIYRQKHDRQDR